MTTPLVVDASVLVKTILSGERFAAEAQVLIADGFRGRRRPVGPPLLLTEATDDVYQALRRGELTPRQADDGVERRFTTPVAREGPSNLTRLAYEFARRFQLAKVHDSHYVVLVQLLSTNSWSGDQRLMNAVGPVAPWLRWIGDYPIPAPDAPSPSEESR